MYNSWEYKRFDELRAKIYPQRGADSISAAVDVVYAIADGAAAVDTRSAVRIVTKGTLPPPASASSGGLKGSLHIAIGGSLTLLGAVGVEILIYLRDTKYNTLIL